VCMQACRKPYERIQGHATKMLHNVTPTALAPRTCTLVRAPRKCWRISCSCWQQNHNTCHPYPKIVRNFAQTHMSEHRNTMHECGSAPKFITWFPWVWDTRQQGPSEHWRYGWEPQSYPSCRVPAQCTQNTKTFQSFIMCVRSPRTSLLAPQWSFGHSKPLKILQKINSFGLIADQQSTRKSGRSGNPKISSPISSASCCACMNSCALVWALYSWKLHQQYTLGTRTFPLDQRRTFWYE